MYTGVRFYSIEAVLHTDQEQVPFHPVASQRPYGTIGLIGSPSGFMPIRNVSSISRK